MIKLTPCDISLLKEETMQIKANIVCGAQRLLRITAMLICFCRTVDASTVTISPSSRTVKVGETVSFNATVTDGSGTLIWYGPSGTLGTGSSVSYQFNSCGTFSISAVLWPCGGPSGGCNPSGGGSAMVTVEGVSLLCNLVGGTTLPTSMTGTISTLKGGSNTFTTP